MKDVFLSRQMLITRAMSGVEMLLKRKQKRHERAKASLCITQFYSQIFLRCPHLTSGSFIYLFIYSHSKPCSLCRLAPKPLELPSAFQKISPCEWEAALLTHDALRGTLSVSLTRPWQRRSFSAQITKWPLQSSLLAVFSPLLLSCQAQD